MRYQLILLFIVTTALLLAAPAQAGHRKPFWHPAPRTGTISLTATITQFGQPSAVALLTAATRPR